MKPRIQYAKTEDGVSIAYAAEGEGPALVLVPNPPVSHVQRAREMMPNMFQPLVRGFRLIAYDPVAQVSPIEMRSTIPWRR